MKNKIYDQLSDELKKYYDNKYEEYFNQLNDGEESLTIDEFIECLR